MQNIIALILANLSTIIEAGKAGFDFVQHVRAAAKQSGEWTEAQEAEFQEKLAAQAIDSAWLTDAALETAALLTSPPNTRASVTVAPEAKPEVASVAAVRCAVCGQELIPDHPENCNCVNA